MTVHVLTEYIELEYVNFENKTIKLQVRRAGSEKYFVKEVFRCLLPWRHNLLLATWVNLGSFRNQDEIRGLDSLGRSCFVMKRIFVGIRVVHDWGKAVQDGLS